MLASQQISDTVEKAVRETVVWDFHTHLYPSSFGTPLGRDTKHDPNGLMLWGIDELVTYHYLIAELFREVPVSELPVDNFWKMSRSEQADLIWKKLFVDATPLSEACRGVLTTLKLLGLDPNEKSLDSYRTWFNEQTPDGQVDRVLEIANVDTVTMTNDIFDPNERQRWLDNPGIASDSRFPAVLRFDPLVVAWDEAAPVVSELGYNVANDLSGKSIDEVKRLLNDWIARMKPVYCAMSLPPSWTYPVLESNTARAATEQEKWGERCLTEAILPVCAEHGLPLALMIGVTRGANPAIRAAGDTVGPADVSSIGRLAKDFAGNQLMVTLLARENQHELAVTARKHRNLTPFGCWWFLNNPSLIEEITRMRVELLGPTFIPQHSDCRILEQLIYKWDHSRAVIGKVLTDTFTKLAETGFEVTEAKIKRDVERYLHGNISDLLKK